MQTYQTERIIDASHPALSGHFPGNPVVPGVVILDAVFQALGEWQAGLAPVQVQNAKFVSPLLPQEALRISLSLRDGSSAGFECRVAGRLVAQGTLALKRDGHEPGLV